MPLKWPASAVAVSGRMAAHYQGSSSSSSRGSSRADPVARVTWSAGDAAPGPGARGPVCLGSSVPLISCVRVCGRNDSPEVTFIAVNWSRALLKIMPPKSVRINSEFIILA